MSSKHRLAAIMFTDIVGYSVLMGHNESMGMELLKKNRNIHKPLIDLFGGQFLKEIGDGILASFDNASSAVLCAAAIQSATQEKGIPLRIGIHQGDIIFQKGDAFGDGVNIASRIQSIAEKGQILISEDVLHNIQNKIGIYHEFKDEVQLKNVKGAWKIYKVYVKNEFLQKVLLSKKAAKGRLLTKLSLGLRKSVTWILSIIVIGLVALLLTNYAELGGQEDNRINSLVVLPMANLMQDTTQDYFCDGMHDALINKLSRIPSLRVISRTSAMRYKNANKALKDIAKELDVDAVIEGSTLKSEDRVRINIKLIALSPERPIMTQSFQRSTEDILLLQDEIAGRIAHEIEQTLPGRTRSLSPVSKVDPLALEMYLKGRHILDPLQAIESLERAVAIDSTYALAYGALAESYILASIQRLKGPVVAVQKARQYAKNALELDPNIVEAYTALAEIECHYNFNWEKGDELLRKALEINPGYARAYFRRSGHLLAMGKFEEMDQVMARGRELEPPSHSAAGFNYYFSGRFTEAIHHFTEEIALEPDHDILKLRRSLCYVEIGDVETGLRDLEELGERHLNDPQYQLELARVYALVGKKKDAQDILQNFQYRAGEPYVSPVDIAKVYVALEEQEKALAELSRAYETKDANLIWLKVEPAFESIREEPGFQNILNKIGLVT